MAGNKKRYLIILYLIFFVFGIATSSIDPIIPIIGAELAIGFDLIGYILFIGYFFLIISNIVSGKLGDIINTKYIMIASLILIISGSITFGIILTIPIFILITILLRLGFGAIDASGVTYVSQLFLKGKSEIIVKLSLLWYTGCVVGPAFISLELYFSLNPRINFLLIPFLFFILTILFSKFAPNSYPEKPTRDKENFFTTIKYPIVIVSATILFFYAGSIFGLSTWLTTYFLTFNIEVFMGSVILSFYWIFSIIGLLINTKLLKVTNEITILTIGFIIGVLSMIIVVVTSNVIIKVVFLLLQAMALSGIFPLLKSIPISENPKASGTITGFVLTMQGAGVMFIQPILGVITNKFGGYYIVYIILAGLVIGLTLNFLLLYFLNKKYKTVLKFKNAN